MTPYSSGDRRNDPFTYAILFMVRLCWGALSGKGSVSKLEG
jgi:hypothetical protein